MKREDKSHLWEPEQDTRWVAFIPVVMAFLVVALMLLSGCGGDRFNKYQHPLCEHNRSACR